MADTGAAERDRVLGILGLARRAGQLAVGTRAVREALADGSARAVVLARDAGENALDRLSGPLGRRRPSIVRSAGAAEIGAALGRERVVAAAITDPGLAEALVAGARSGTGSSPAGRPEGSGGRSPGTE